MSNGGARVLQAILDGGRSSDIVILDAGQAPNILGAQGAAIGH